MYITFNFSSKKLKVWKDFKNLDYEKTVKSFHKLSFIEIAGILCQGIRKGHSLEEVANGDDWRPNKDEFLAWVNTDTTVKDLYLLSKRARYDLFREKYFALSKQETADDDAEKKRVKKLDSIERMLKVLKDDGTYRDNTIVIEHNSWKGEDA